MDKIDYARRKQLNDIASQFRDIYLNWQSFLNLNP